MHQIIIEPLSMYVVILLSKYLLLNVPPWVYLDISGPDSQMLADFTRTRTNKAYNHQNWLATLPNCDSLALCSL